MRIILAQISPVVADYPGNLERILSAALRAKELGGDLVVFPELAICGYPPRDLLEQSAFVEQGEQALQELAKRLPEIPAVVGFVDRVTVETGSPLRNAAAVLQHGRVQSIHHKRLLPTYDVFDEDRYFGPAETIHPVEIGGRKIALTICEDIWSEASLPRRLYPDDPVGELIAAGAELVINISASPFHIAKVERREAMLQEVATRHGVPVLYCNQVGGNDELLFDGHSVFVDSSGAVQARGPGFEEELLICNLDKPQTSSPLVEIPSQTEEQVRRALVMGVRDYATRCGFSEVLLGLSGGIDSALTCVIAAEALGADKVLAVSMPSRYSSEGSRSDAQILAENLGVRLIELPIEGPFAALLELLSEPFANCSEDVTEENLQARIRGTLLMALSNKFGSLLLTTGNKSELAVGYCTLYGDMNGGLAVISDLPKTLVYRVCEHINEVAGEERIPEDIITKAPSAELRPDQTDQDSLPPYDLLDAILEGYVVEGKNLSQLVEEGFSEDTCRRILGLVDRNEYKRRQAAPGLRVTTKAFGVGRRFPIACRRHRG